MTAFIPTICLRRSGENDVAQTSSLPDEAPATSLPDAQASSLPLGFGLLAERDYDGSRGFTLVELLVSTAIIALILLVLVQVTNQMSQTWRYTVEKVEKFQEARDGFEAMTRRISQATLNTYWDYYNSSGETHDQTTATKFLPFTYGRQSELRFLSGPMQGPTWSLTSNTSVTAAATQYWPTHGIFFQSSLGAVSDLPSMDPSNPRTIFQAMDNLLNTWGYFVEVASDSDQNIGTSRPAFVKAPIRWRARLMELMEPAEYLHVYDTTKLQASANRRDWFLTSLGSKYSDTPPRPVHVLAENIVALVILPKLSKQDEDSRGSKGPWWLLSPNYTYDSTLLPTAPSGTTVTSSYKYSPVNPGASVISTTDSSDAANINPRNQLPPIVQVTMIAVDERSAQRLDDLSKTNGASTTSGAGHAADLLSDQAKGDAGYGTLFTVAQKGPSATDPYKSYEDDLAALEQKLIARKATYRVFSTNVTIRGAKWSRAQAD